MSDMAERLVAGLRDVETRRPYQLDRPNVRSIAEALAWLRDWCGDDDRSPWRAPDFGDTERLNTLKRLLFARFRHRAEWIKRGGR
jgi:hypothetical protein